MNESTDFIATELLKELKESNARKDAMIVQQNKNLVRVICGFLCVIVMIVAGFLWYLNQYDFTSTTTTTNSAEGVYAIVDSEGNVITSDLTPEDLERILIAHGESIQEGNDN